MENHATAKSDKEIEVGLASDTMKIIITGDASRWSTHDELLAEAARKIEVYRKKLSGK